MFIKDKLMAFLEQEYISFDIYDVSSNTDHGVSVVSGRIILKWTCEMLDGGAWTGSIWLRIGTGGELL
jgi:hypothetical protein